MIKRSKPPGGTGLPVKGVTADREMELRDALACSCLHDLPHQLVAELLQGARLVDCPAGSLMHRYGDAAFACLVVSGLIRTFVSAPSGRTATIRYSRLGTLLGVASLFNLRSPHLHAHVSAVADSRLLLLQPDVVRSLAGHEVRIAQALLAEASGRVADFIDELEASSFASVRQRLARHLLDRAVEKGPPLVARATQEELASAIGSVREMVVRVLHDLRDEGVVRTGRGQVELLDPLRLEGETYPHLARRL